MSLSWCWGDWGTLENRNIYGCLLNSLCFCELNAICLPKCSVKCAAGFGEVHEKTWAPWLGWWGWGGRAAARGGKGGSRFNKNSWPNETVKTQTLGSHRGVRLCKRGDRRLVTILYRFQRIRWSQVCILQCANFPMKRKIQSSGSLFETRSYLETTRLLTAFSSVHDNMKHCRETVWNHVIASG